MMKQNKAAICKLFDWLSNIQKHATARQYKKEKFNQTHYFLNNEHFKNNIEIEFVGVTHLLLMNEIMKSKRDLELVTSHSDDVI